MFLQEQFTSIMHNDTGDKWQRPEGKSGRHMNDKLFNHMSLIMLWKRRIGVQFSAVLVLYGLLTLWTLKMQKFIRVSKSLLTHHHLSSWQLRTRDKEESAWEDAKKRQDDRVGECITEERGWITRWGNATKEKRPEWERRTTKLLGVYVLLQ